MSKKSRQEYLDENREFYSREYAWVLSEWAHCFASAVMILVYAVVALCVEWTVFRCYYYQQARIVLTDGMEVADWVKKEATASMLGMESVVIISCGLISILYILILTLVTKNYELYKYRFLICILPFAFMAIVGIFFAVRICQMDMLPWVNTSSLLPFVSTVCTYAPLLLSVRSFVTAETRVRDTALSKFFECISKFISNS